MTWDPKIMITADGYHCTLPAGKYYIGDPHVLLTTHAHASIGEVKEGLIQEGELFIFIYEFGHSSFMVSYGDSHTLNIASGVIAVMSANAVRPMRDMEQHAVEFKSAFDIDTSITKLWIYNKEKSMLICEYDSDGEEEYYE